MVFVSDKSLNLDILLIQISPHINSKWYQFGLAIGIPKEILDKCLDYPTEQSVIEVLDYWLRIQKQCKPTWKVIAKGLQTIGYDNLAEGILNVYKTGNTKDLGTSVLYILPYIYYSLLLAYVAYTML